MADPEQNTRQVIGDYIGSDTKRIVDLPQIPRREESTLEDQPVGEIDEETLRKIQEFIWGDHVLKDIEEFALFRNVRQELQRLAQENKDVSYPEREYVEHRIQQFGRQAVMIISNHRHLEQFVEAEELMKEAGLKSEVDKSTDRNLHAYLSALKPAEKQFLAFKQYRMLVRKQLEQGDVPQEDMNRALAELPQGKIEGRYNGAPATTLFDREHVADMPIDAVLQDEQMNYCQEILEQKINWLISLEEGVPGVEVDQSFIREFFSGIKNEQGEKLIGRNPIDLFLTEYLTKAVVATKDEEIRLSLEEKSNSREGKIDKIVELREALRRHYKKYREEEKRALMARVEHFTVGFFNKEYAEESGSQPEREAVLELIHENKEWRETVTAHKDAMIKAFSKHREGLDKFLGSTWKTYLENKHKKVLRYKVIYPFMDALVRTRELPGAARNIFIPDFLDFLEKDLDKAVADKLEGLRKAWGLPDTVIIEGKKVPFEPNKQEHWEALSEDDWKRALKMMESTEDVINRHRDDLISSLDSCVNHVNLFDELWKIKHPAELIGVEPDTETFEDLINGKTTVQKLLSDPSIKNDLPKVQAAYFYVFSAMPGILENYFLEAGVTDEDIFDLATRSIKTGREIADAAKDMGFPYGLASMLALVIWYASAYGRQVLWHNRLKPVRNSFWAFARMGKDVRGTYRIGRRIITGKKTPKAGKSPRGPRAKPAEPDSPSRANPADMDTPEPDRPVIKRGNEAAIRVNEKLDGKPELRAAHKRMLEIDNEIAEFGREVGGKVSPEAASIRDNAIRNLRTEQNQLRNEVAKGIVGKKNFNTKVQTAIADAHAEPRIHVKRTILQKALGEKNNDLVSELLESGLCGDVKKGAIRLDKLRGAIRSARSADDVDDLLRSVAKSPEIDPSDLSRLQRARGLGKAAGVGLVAFGVLVDGFFMHLTSKEIAAAEEANRKEEARILRSKFRSQAGEAVFGIGTGGLALGGALSGPPGWIALTGLAAKSVTSDALYDYALELNRTNLREYLNKVEPELAGIIKGHDDWSFDNEKVRGYRHELALDAYLLKSCLPFLGRIKKEHWSLYFLNDIRKHLRDQWTGGTFSPGPADIEEAIWYAEHRYRERASEEHEAPAPPSFSAEKAREERVQKLFNDFLMLRTLEKEGDMSKEEARMHFVNEASDLFLKHDIAFYRKAVIGKNQTDQFPHENTIMEIMSYTVGDLYDFKDTEHPEKFAKLVLEAQRQIRSFLGADKTLDPTKRRGTFFGRRPRPRLE